MKTERDYEDFLGLLNKHEVRYCIVGSYALAFHARPRYTKDIDILVDPAPENAERIIKVIDEFGLSSLGLSAGDFCAPGVIIQLGYEPVRIDIITSIEGMDFSGVWDSRAMGPYGKHEVSFIGREHLIESKRISNRTQDKADLEVLLSESEESES